MVPAITGAFEPSGAMLHTDPVTGGKEAWFEISNVGWRVQTAGRLLASLIYEGIQNAFDQEVTKVTVEVAADRITIEDNGSGGFADPKLAYTVYLTDKGESAVMRGRHGRGLKEMISAMDSAVIESPGFTMSFDESGRAVGPGTRKRGTRVLLRRQNRPQEIEKCLATLRMLMPPEGVEVRINGKKITRAPRFAVLSGCSLDTVLTIDGAERQVARDATVTLLKPRHSRERPHIFEMGLPIQPGSTPWHIDVGQRIPLSAQRDRIGDAYRLHLLALLFESLVPSTLGTEDLKEDWLSEAISRCRLSDQALRAYTQRAFPVRSVLPGSPSHNDRARQSGANVLDVAPLGRAHLKSLGRVMETSEQFVARRQKQEERVRATQPHEQRAVAFLANLARRILGHSVKIRLMRKAADPDGLIESATYDRKKKEMNINIEGKMDLRNPLSVQTLGIFFHELAHVRTNEHNLSFIESLEQIAGRGAVILALEGRAMAETCGVPFCEPEPGWDPDTQS